MPGGACAFHSWGVVWKRITKTVLVLLGLVLVATGAFGPLSVTSADATASAEIDEAHVVFAGAATIETVRYGDSITLVDSFAIVAGHFDEADKADEAAAADPAAIDLWTQVVAIVPPVYLAQIKQFSIFDEGPAGTVAMVHQSGLDQSAWILSIDRADAADLELLRETLLHELAHIITLDTSQFTFLARIDDGQPCEGVLLPLGCAHAGSMLDSWATQFWADPAQAAAFSVDGFVASYAASAPHEDLAETFLYWAQGDTDAPADSVLAAKFAWFDSQPSLVSVRATLVAGSI